ncbi:MAG TPA: hypothetical protein VKA54_02735 [Gemmatimonadaceae bacterium]|nr:hypothetical protein [Gemmatimonadaceae bacterium]
MMDSFGVKIRGYADHTGGGRWRGARKGPLRRRLARHAVVDRVVVLT